MPMNERRRRRADHPGGPGAEKRVEHQVAGVGGGEKHAHEQRFGLLRGMGLAPRLVPEPFRAHADRQEPVGADLAILVAGLERLVIERIALGVGPPRRPDHRLVGVGEAPAAEVRHRIGFAPHDVVENPEAEILENGADAEDVVVGADDDDRGRGLHQPPDGGEPAAREGVILGEIGELVPVVVDRVDQALVGPRKRAFELQIVRGIGEHEVDRGFGKRVHLLDAVADQNDVPRDRALLKERSKICGRAFRLAGASTQNLKLAGEAQRSGARDTHERNHFNASAGSFEPARRLCSIVSKGRVMRPSVPLCRFRTASVFRKDI